MEHMRSVDQLRVLVTDELFGYGGGHGIFHSVSLLITVLDRVLHPVVWQQVRVELVHHETHTEGEHEPREPTVRVDSVLLEVSEHFVDLVLRESVGTVHLRIDTDGVRDFWRIDEDSGSPRGYS